MNKCILKQQLYVAHCVTGKHINLENFKTFPRWKYSSNSPARSVCSRPLTSDILIKGGGFTQRGRVSKSLLKEPSLITTSQSF